MPSKDSKSLEGLDRESLKAIGKELERHFPDRQEATELVLMGVSPHRLHAYWHIMPLDLEGVLNATKDPHARLVIRFYDLSQPTTGQPARHEFDLELTETSGSRYVELWQDARHYTAELGLRTADGGLLKLARSNRVELPRSEQSPRAGSRVLTLTPGEARLYHPPTDINHGGIGGFHQAWRENPDQPADLTLLDSGAELYPEFPNPLQEDKGEQPLRLPAYRRIKAVEITPRTSEAQLSGRLPDPTLTNGPLASMPSLMPTREFPLSPIETLDWDLTYDLPLGILTWPSSPLPPWPDALPIPHPVAISVPPPAGISSSFPDSSAQPLSSFELGPQAQAEPEMELHMELHIRGHKPPDGPFILFDQPIPTDEQGNFSLTRVLPPGVQQLVAQLLTASRDH
jgi:hypothetical protein